ncbi:MAG: nitrate reductase molybdenum cofactor assembly chaperone [Bacillales bacterium]
MKSKEHQHLFLLCSYLLSYPDLDFLETLPEIEEEAEKLPLSESKVELGRFLQLLQEKSETELLYTYVYTFDFGKKTNLYVTYMANGEQRERGQELLFLKNYYKTNGFLISGNELPDYLPLMLEFAGLVDWKTAKPVFERYANHIKEIETRLEEENNFYHHLLKAVTLAIKDRRIDISAKRSETKCSSNFCGPFSHILS